jgi:hypothetical protein
LSSPPRIRQILREVKEAYDGKKKLSHEERIELWKKRGLPLVLGKG